MTAEIAILNWPAVTLAADSAMTLNIGGAEEIYTSADKILWLSERDPIGIMVYNNLDEVDGPRSRHRSALKWPLLNATNEGSRPP
jgi:hypothetical protein